ncbi:hypothetical protein B0F90DRAFT_1686016 [Multifurca ochricompacta]|uniref:Uncharacterized protein n=1 Tax=Multifurca ochricompacta TaxID=376703 RepID=A0AAD4MB83_9AGAM|nr:hypothetical protein B0F90DRAFT_1686016 [Multifurca ochricompacta]
MDFRRPAQLLTPPETGSDFLVGGHHAVDLMNTSGVHIADSDMHAHPFVSTPVRRVSTLAYHSSPLRDPRERVNTRQSRWLVVVIPPVSLVQEHGPLGHTLASGPPQRLSQGVLMPLLPTMYGQLSAIAREFNFPSPLGICLYLHVVEQGFTMTPRISDEIWPALWGHWFEGQSPVPGQQTPICGRIEFDIDRRKARWFDSWLTSDRRHAVDVPVSVPPSLSHWRGDSKNSFLDERGDEQSEVLPGLSTGARGRHIPKKLSLVDKLETFSVASSIGYANAGSNEPSTSLTAIVQEDEPKTAKLALEKRVESWRASSSITPTPIAAIGQTNFDPVHVPSRIELGNIEILAVADGLDLDEFQWSVSSIGPPDDGSLASAVSRSEVPSVHLDRRLEGSVVLSPSTATSWGPQTLDYSPVSTLSRLPSLDLGRRVTDDCPPTPSTATSWGPEDRPNSPVSILFRLPSPDLGQRALEECPPTPSTVSSLGREELSYSPVSVGSGLPSLDLGTRVFDESSRVTEASSIPPLHLRSHTFPYFTAPIQPIWPLVWPFYGNVAASSVPPSRLPKLYPAIEIYDTSYPHFEVFPGHICSGFQSAPEAGLTGLESSYPTLRIYLPVYPYLCIYPPLPADSGSEQNPESPLPQKFPSESKLGTQYPYFDMYPAFHPTNLPCVDPTAALPRTATSLPVRLPAIYPAVEPYSPEYPFVSPYPPNMVPYFSKVDETKNDAAVHSDTRQQVYMNGHRPFYPAFNIYPTSVKCERREKNISLHLPKAYSTITLCQVHHNLISYGWTDPEILAAPATYPEFDLYPLFYMDKMDIVPKTDLWPQYPCIRIYPINYPCFEIYPGYICDGRNDIATCCGSSLQPAYPQLDIYPLSHPPPKIEDQRVPPSVRLPTQYPALSPYPPTYPHFEIFPSVAQIHDILTAKQYSPVGEGTPSSEPAAVEVISGLTLTSISRKAHKELHEEVFGASVPLKESVKPVMINPLATIQARGRVRSGTLSPRLASPQTISSFPSALPAVPPILISNRPSFRMTSYAEAQQDGFPTHPTMIAGDGGSMAHSDTFASASSNQYRGTEPPKHSHRPRDSLVLEKARLLNHVHPQPHNDPPSTFSVLGESTPLPVPPVPQLPSDISRPQKLDHSEYPFT